MKPFTSILIATAILGGIALARMAITSPFTDPAKVEPVQPIVDQDSRPNPDTHDFELPDADASLLDWVLAPAERRTLDPRDDPRLQHCSRNIYPHLGR